VIEAAGDLLLHGVPGDEPLVPDSRRGALRRARRLPHPTRSRIPGTTTGRRAASSGESPSASMAWSISMWLGVRPRCARPAAPRPRPRGRPASRRNVKNGRMISRSTRCRRAGRTGGSGRARPVEASMDAGAVAGSMPACIRMVPSTRRARSASRGATGRRRRPGASAAACSMKPGGRAAIHASRSLTS
jgi:hypothetical protein